VPRLSSSRSEEPRLVVLASCCRVELASVEEPRRLGLVSPRPPWVSAVPEVLGLPELPCGSGAGGDGRGGGDCLWSPC